MTWLKAFPVSRKALQAEAARYAGCKILRRARSVGRVIGLYDGREAGHDIDAGPDGEIYPWSTMCEDHGTVIQHRTRAIAALHLSHPEEWCDECRGIVERRRFYR